MMKPMIRSEVYNVDCIEYMRSLPDAYFDLAVADPPYGGAGNDNIDGGKRFGGRFDAYRRKIVCSRTGGAWASKFGKDIIGWDVAPPQEFFDELFRVSKNQIIWGANYFVMPPTRCFLIWRKLTISDVFTMAMAEYAWTSFNDNAKVFEKPPQNQSGRFHPTAKPKELYAWIYRLFANEGDVVFDPMMGSQSSRIAAYKMGLDYVGCEIDKDYFEKGNKRFECECYGVSETPDGTLKQLQLF